MKEDLKRADILFEQGRWEQALEAYHAFLAEFPDDAHVMCQIARCYLKLELFGEASAYAADAGATNPDFAYAYYIQAYIFHLRNLHEDARRAIEVALSLDPMNPDFHVLAGRLKAYKNEWVEALEAADLALESNPDHADARVLKSSALIHLRRFDEAVDLLQSVLRADPEDEFALMELGNLYLHKGEWDRAAEVFQSALAIDPESRYAQKGLLEALRAKYPLYGLVLRYFLWMQRFSKRYQQLITYGSTFLARYLEHVRKNNPALAPLLGFVLLIWRIFVYLTWTIHSATTLLLRFNKFGRQLVTDRDIWESNLVGGLWLGAAGCALYHYMVDPFTIFCRIGMPVFLTLPLVVGGAFASPKEGWPKYVSYGILAVMSFCSLAGLVLYTWMVPLGKTLLLFYFQSINIVLFVLAMLEGVETRKD